MIRVLSKVSLALVVVAAAVAWAQESPPPLTPPQAPSGPTPMPAVLRNYTPVTEARLRSPNDGDWMMNRRTYDGWGYSPLTQITPANVARLRPVWSFSTGAINGHEAAPIVHDGVMFVATPGSQVIAIEAATGTVLWRYRRPLAPSVINRHPTTRGVGLLGDKVFLAASDAVLMALDARTGRTVWSTHGGRQPQRPLHEPRPARGRRQGARRHVGRRAGHPRVHRRLRSRHRQGTVEDLHRSGAGRARQRDVAEGRRSVEDRRRLGVGDGQLRSRDRTWPTGAPATAGRGWAISVPATTSTPPRRSPWTWPRARSRVTSSTRPTNRSTGTRCRRRFWWTSSATAAR